MALLEDRLELPSVVKITSLDFDSASDAAAREQDKALSAKKEESSPSLLDSLKFGDKSLLDEFSSMFNSIMCNGLMPFELRLDNLLGRLLKGLGLDLDLGLGCLLNGVLLDQILGRRPFSFLNFGLGGLSLSKQMLIGMLFGADAAKLAQLFGSSGISACSKNKMLGLLNGNLGLSGMGLAQRLNMLTMLNSTLNDCNTKAYTNNVSNNWTINNITNAVTINNMINLDPAVTKAYLDKLLATVPTMTNYDKSTMLTGLGMSIADTTTGGIVEKLTLLNGILNAITNSTDKALTSGALVNYSGSILTSLNNATIITNNPTGTLNTILTGLDNANNKWNIDPITGTINYGVIANNTPLVNLAKQSIITTQYDTTIDNQVTTTGLNQVQTISVVSSISDSNNEIANVISNSLNSSSIVTNSNKLDNIAKTNSIMYGTGSNSTSYSANGSINNNGSNGYSNNGTNNSNGSNGTSNTGINNVSNGVNNGVIDNSNITGTQPIIVNNIEAMFIDGLGIQTPSLYNNIPLNALYDMNNNKSISCCLQSICIAS